MYSRCNTVKTVVFGSVVCAIVALSAESFAEGQMDPRTATPDDRPAESSPPSTSPVTPAVLPRIADLRNHPNPFNSTTTISFSLHALSTAELRIYDILDREVDRVDLGVLNEGQQSIVWSSGSAGSADLPTGIYFYRIIAGSTRGTGKMLLLK
jgi:hypothetical protein